MEGGGALRDDTKNVCGADYDMCRWLDFLVFWCKDSKPQALTSVVNYYPWKTPGGMTVDDKMNFIYNFRTLLHHSVTFAAVLAM